MNSNDAGPIYSAMFDLIDLIKYMFNFLDSIVIYESSVISVSFVDAMLGFGFISIVIGFILRALGSGTSIGLGGLASSLGESIRSQNAPPQTKIHLHYKAGNWGGRKSDT